MISAAAASVEADEILRQVAIVLKKKRLRASDLFKQVDASGDGCIDAGELREGFKNIIGFETSDEEFNALMKIIDKDGGGDVSLKEFEKAMRLAEKLVPKKKQEAPKKKKGISQEELVQFEQMFGLFRQICQRRQAVYQGDVDADSHLDLVVNDKSGTVNVKELEYIFEVIGLKYETEDAAALLALIDVDGSGDISLNEFVAAMSQTMTVDTPVEEVSEAFRSFSKSAPAGMISINDLKNALTTYLYKEVTEAEVDQMLDRYKDCFVRPPGSSEAYFNWQEYLEFMSPSPALNQAPGE